MKFRRHLTELAGQIEPTTGLSVRKLHPFNFEYQVGCHVRAYLARFPNAPRRAVETDVRARLATGQAWLYPEHLIEQLELFQPEHA
jgi:hypothetical protein